MDKAKLLDRQPTLVRADVFLHDLAPLTLEHLRRALAQGLTPSDVEIGDDGIVILRFTRPRAGDAQRLEADQQRACSLEHARMRRGR
jgi:hypothetical protein